MNLQQLLALIVLRYKLTQHQQRKAGQLNLILARVMRVVILVGAIASFFVPILIGPWVMADIETHKLIAAWNAVVMLFLFSLAMTLVGQLQLNEVISIDKLLHLPVSLNGAFLINYLSSFANMLMLIFAPAMLGYTVGMIIAKGSSVFILLPALLAIFFLSTSIFHQLKAIFARVMHNKRNKALVVVVIPFVMVVGFVLFSFAEDTIGQGLGSSDIVRDTIRGWVRWTPGWFSIAALVALGCASQYFSYRSLQKFYTGDSAGTSSKRKRLYEAWPSNLLFRQLPLASTGASAIATSGFRNIIRAPEALMALVPLVIALLVGTPYLVGYGNFVVPDTIRPWIQIGLVTVTMLGFPAFLFTSFSYDRDGFRAFILSPVDRADVLYGKNLAAGLPTFVSGFVLLAIAQIFLPDSSMAFLASVIQLPACYFVLCIVGNFLSVWFPVGLKRGNMQPANAPVIHTILLYAGIVICPFMVVQPAMLFIFIEMLAGGNFGQINGWLYLLLSIGQLVATIFIYLWTLGPFGKWLWQQESTILEVVANIPE